MELSVAAAGKGIHGSQAHLRDLFVLPLSGLRRAGVFAGVDSEDESRFYSDPPADWRGGFLIGEQFLVRCAVHSS
jgi:hypothetical protein